MSKEEIIVSQVATAKTLIFIEKRIETYEKEIRDAEVQIIAMQDKIDALRKACKTFEDVKKLL